MQEKFCVAAFLINVCLENILVFMSSNVGRQNLLNVGRSYMNEKKKEVGFR